MIYQQQTVDVDVKEEITIRVSGLSSYCAAAETMALVVIADVAEITIACVSF